MASSIFAAGHPVHGTKTLAAAPAPAPAGPPVGGDAVAAALDAITSAVDQLRAALGGQEPAPAPTAETIQP